MCGIVGYVGKENAALILIDCLKRLEYRGYDSAGLVVFNGSRIKLVKAKGRVGELENKMHENWRGNIGIAHTRWATHGEPNEKNAHPHADCTGRIFVCHNGIIENYKSLKTSLISRGHKFKSDTDTEVLPHLLEENLRYGPELAIIKSLKLVKGAYGLTIIFAEYPDRIIAVKNSSPLVIGFGDSEHMVASDASAVLGRTHEVIYLNDDEMAILTKNCVKVLNISQNSKISKFFTKNRFNSNKKDFLLDSEGYQIENVFKRKEKLDSEVDNVQKNGYPFFMLKEIFEQPESIKNTLRGRLAVDKDFIKLGGLEQVKNRLKNLNRLIITGCGTAYLAGTIGKLMIEELSGIPCESELASELRYRRMLVSKQNLAMVAISQSGETADTLAALRNFSDKKEKNAPTLGIVNVVGSTIARETDAGIYNHAGPEIGVASTKAFTSQVTILVLLALFLGQERGILSADNRRKIISEIHKLPVMVKKILDQKEKVKLISKKYFLKYSAKKGYTSNNRNYNNFFYIGRKYNFPVALEGALKLKEVSYIHAEGYGAGEMKHGPIAMIDEYFPTVAIAPVDSVYDKIASNMEEIRARRGKIIAITTEGNKKISHIADDWLYIPKTLEMLTPILAVIPLQLFAYYMGILRGYDVDKPRNLAKSVTVE